MAGEENNNTRGRNNGYLKRLVTNVRLTTLSGTNRAAMASIVYTAMIAIAAIIGDPFEKSKYRKVLIGKAMTTLGPSIGCMTGFIFMFIISLIIVWPTRIRPHIVIMLLSFFIWTLAEWLRRASEIKVVCGPVIINGALFESAGVILLFGLLCLLCFFLHTFK